MSTFGDVETRWQHVLQNHVRLCCLVATLCAVGQNQCTAHVTQTVSCLGHSLSSAVFSSGAVGAGAAGSGDPL